jgi:hypothetical protein
VQGIPCRAAVRAVAHPATPDPRISRRSCGAADDEEEVEREVEVDWLRVVVVVVEVVVVALDKVLLPLLLVVALKEDLRPPPTTKEEGEEMDEKHLTSPT